MELLVLVIYYCNLLVDRTKSLRIQIELWKQTIFSIIKLFNRSHLLCIFFLLYSLIFHFSDQTSSLSKILFPMSPTHSAPQYLSHCVPIFLFWHTNDLKTLAQINKRIIYFSANIRRPLCTVQLVTDIYLLSCENTKRILLSQITLKYEH